MAWIAGQQAAPFTGREGAPERRVDAELEFRAGGATIDTTGRLWALTAAELGLSEWIPRARHPKWSTGAYRTVKWMLSGEVKDTPLDIPVRLADGTTPTAEQLYGVAFAACPRAFDLPERRQELLLRTAANAARYRKLAALIEDAKSSQ